MAAESRLGYRFSKHLVVKAEYAFEQGRELGAHIVTTSTSSARKAAFKF